MRLLLYVLFILIVMLLYLLFRQMKKSVLVTILCSVSIIYFIAYPKLCIASTLSGVRIFFMSVFPSLFPFLVISNILLVYDGIGIYSKLFGRYLCIPLRLPANCSFVLLVSALCGYPLGAKYACDLYSKKMITSKQCERLLNIATNASPLFVIGAVGTTMLGSSTIGYLLLISNYISCILMGLLLPYSGTARDLLPQLRSSGSESKVNFGGAFKESIDAAVKTCLSIGGYITMFAVIIDIIKNNVIYNIVINNFTFNFLNRDLVSGLFLGLVEITKGSYIIASSNAAMLGKIFVIGFFLGFSGISIISQVYSFTFKFEELSILKYIKRKFVQGILCGLVSSAAVMLFSRELAAQPAISRSTLVSTSFPLWIGLLLIIPLLVHNVKKLLHIS